MKHLSRYLVIILALLMITPAAAQDEGQTARWNGTPLEVVLPDGWTVVESGASMALELAKDDLAIAFYPPMGADASPQEAFEVLMNRNSDVMQFGEIIESEILSAEALRLDFTSTVRSGFNIGFDYDGQTLFIVAGVEDSAMTEENEAIIQEVLDSLRPIDIPELPDIQLAHFDGTPQVAVEELAELGLVSGSAGRVVFSEDILFPGLNPTDITASYGGGQLVMGGLISWRAVEGDTSYHVCGMTGQSTYDSDTSPTEDDMFVIVGIDSDSDVVMLEADFADMESSVPDYFDSGIDIHDPQHLLMIINDGRVTTFINGRPVMADYALRVAGGDDERYAGYLMDAGCVMTDVWGYSFD